MSLIKSKIFSVLLVLFSTFVGFLILELITQIYFKNDKWANINSKANILYDFNFHYQLAGLYDSDKPFVHYKRNKFGLRDRCKDPSFIKLLTIGGSTTDQRYIPFSSTFQSVLEYNLKEHSNKDFCVSNAGVDGHSTFGHLFSFDYWFPLIPNLKPKYILLYIGINDTDIFNNNPNTGFDSNNLNSIKSILKRSYIINFLYPVYKKVRYGKENSSMPYLGHFPENYKLNEYVISNLNSLTKKLSARNAELFKQRLLKILSKIQKIGAKPICVSQPHNFTKIVNGKKLGLKNIMANNFSGLDFDYSLLDLNKVMSEVCGIHFIDLYSKKFKDHFFYDGVHTTARGSEFIGKILAEYFIKNELLDNK